MTKNKHKLNKTDWIHICTNQGVIKSESLHGTSN